MADPVHEIIASFVAWLVPRLDIDLDATPARLWTHTIEETGGGDNVTDPVSVIRQYPGGTPGVTAPTGHALVQVYTRGRSAAATIQQAARIDAALRDDTGLPVIEATLDGYRLAAIANVRAPGMIGRDPKNRVEVTQNFELFYTRA